MAAKQKNESGKSGKAEPGKASREDRLRAALRANLQRRKAQERARREAAADGEQG